MTLVEFLHPVLKKGWRELCLAALYFEQRYSDRDSLTVDDLRTLLKRARIPRAANANLADVLAKAAPFVDASGKDGNRILWSLTTSGGKHVRSVVGLPEAEAEIEQDVASLEALLRSVSDKNVAEYVEESIKCLSIGALRAAVVFLWAGAVRTIQEESVAKGVKAVNNALLKFDPKARTIKRVDDFAYVKESTLLLTSQELGIFDKNQREMLEDALKLRNKCGHPGKYRPGPNKVRSFVEDVVNIVFA